MDVGTEAGEGGREREGEGEGGTRARGKAKFEEEGKGVRPAGERREEGVEGGHGRLVLGRRNGAGVSRLRVRRSCKRPGARYQLPQFDEMLEFLVMTWIIMLVSERLYSAL